jgi:hypothetical protein
VNIGADRRKLIWLGAIVVLGGAFVWYENSDDSSPSSTTVAAPVAAPVVRAVRTPTAERRRASAASQANEFQPRLGPRTPEERVDPATVDPTIRLDLLAKVQAVEMGSPGRNLFDFGAAPVSETPIAMPKNVVKIAVNHPPATAPAPISGPPPAPQAPPMTFKYYGYKISSSDGRKAAFLLDGDDILVAGENDTVKHRYKVVKIGVNSITIEDTQFKSTQTLPLQEQTG